ncbi:MAG: glycosyltransferase family 2 protein [Gammaproteobacteria bacterium]
MELWLSICIPTYNRSELLSGLLSSIFSAQGNFEVCIFVDGSTDNTIDMLSQFGDRRLKFCSSDNRGRAAALESAVKMASGRFVMIFDDDDSISPGALQKILDDCSRKLTDGCLGYIYLMSDESGNVVGSSLPEGISNFLALRADYHVTGDKKEVVLRDEMLRVLWGGGGLYRRVPTSLFWSRLAVRGDVVCRNVVVGQKTYLANGMSNTISRLKTRNAWPMVLLYVAHLQGYLLGRYFSKAFLIKAISGVFYYSLVETAGRIRRVLGR